MPESEGSRLPRSSEAAAASDPHNPRGPRVRPPSGISDADESGRGTSVFNGPDESLVADAREGMTPGDFVDRKLASALKGGALPADRRHRSANFRH